MNLKRSLIPFLVFFSLAATAQTAHPIYARMPPEGLTLDSGWHYSHGDDPAFAAPGFDDTKWQPINPIQEVHNMPQLKNTNIGWLRLHFTVSAKISAQTLIMNVWQNCASEIYLDGKLIARQGTVNSNPDKMVPMGMNEPNLVIHLEPNKEHVLAVRFSVWHGAAWTRLGGEFFSASIIDFDGYQAQNVLLSMNISLYVIYVSIFFLLSLLHLSFFRYDPSQRANLFFAIYALTSTVSFGMVCLQSYFQDARWYALVSTPTFIINLMGSIWIINALGNLFHYKIKHWLVLMWTVYFLFVIYLVFVELNISIFFGCIAFFTLVELGISIKALRDRKRGAGIIASGLLASILAGLALVISFLFRNAFTLDEGSVIRNMMDLIATVAPAVGISVYLAREFALDSGLLREKLVQVEALSTQSLAYEQEKQQILAGQKQELEKQVKERTNELQASLDSLKAAQEQLIQSEKMASLGELTAGIAHEIQNPLNFVNNFSEVSAELVTELNEELDKGDIGEAKVIAADLQQNLGKIHHHGRRAADIVKGMLEHSRSSTGQKEPTNINKLTDEYLRLAYHGLRAKDKSFQARLLTNFGKELPLIEVVPQDIGRVLLNLYNNAFYAIHQKQKAAPADYQPTVKVTTSLQGDLLQIDVEDNGNGIPDDIRDKIMQPFFTTKPTGQGTGLGLSLSYDIIVKGHGGNITVNSKSGEGTVMCISLPV